MAKPDYCVPEQLAAALIAPAAPFSWEVQYLLENDTLESGRIPIRWQRPVEVVGMYASVRQATSSSLLVPTVDDIQVALGANQRERFTNRLEDTAQTSMAESFVTLGALMIQTPRLLRLQLVTPAPEMDVTFRWKSNNDITDPLFEDALIGLCFLCRDID